MAKLGLFLLFIGVLTACTQKQSITDLQKSIEAKLAGQPGHFAVAFTDLSSNEQLLINAHELFHAASTMKTPVMVEVYKQAAAGKFSLKDSIIIKNEFISIADGSPYLLTADSDSYAPIYKHIGEKRTIYSLVYDMIIVSSNLATNLMIDLVGAKNVTQTLRDIGANDIQVLRGVEDAKAFDAGLNNQVTAYDLMLLFEKIDAEEIVNNEASMSMIDILLDQRFNEIIPAKLPANVKVAHKTGSITGVQHDSWIVYLPDGKKYVLVLLSKDLPDADAGVAVLADISKMIYDYAK